MNSKQLIKALKSSFDATTDQDLRRKLGVSAMTLNNWRKRRTVTPRLVAALLRRLAEGSPTGEAVIIAVKKKLRAASLSETAKKLGITNQAIQVWKGRKTVTTRQIAGLIASTSAALQKETHATAIRPLVEFFPIAKTRSRQKAKYDVFSIKDAKNKPHPYLSGLRAEMEKNYGVYVFFDSRGQAIYSGKARKQHLWKELNLAFNRKRGSLQKIRRVKHPSRRQKYRTAQERSRQVKEYSVPLHELAHYFSAYVVVDGMVDVVESLLVRSFANDLLNKRMETFRR